MKVALVLFMAIGLATSDKLDRTYLPPPGSKLAGGSPGAIQVPLEYPKLSYSTTAKPIISYDISRYPNIPPGVNSNERQNLGTESSTPSTKFNPTQVSSNLPGAAYSPSQTSSRPASETSENIKQYYGFPEVMQDKQISIDHLIMPLSKTLKQPHIFSTSQSTIPIKQSFDSNDENIEPKFIDGEFPGEIREYQYGHPGSLHSGRLNSVTNLSTLPGSSIDKINEISKIMSIPGYKSSQNYPNQNANKLKNFNAQDNDSDEKLSLTNGIYGPSSSDTSTFSSTTPYSKYADYVSSEDEYPKSRENIQGEKNPNNIPSETFNYSARPQANSDREAVILNYVNVINPDGNFAYSFDTSNGIHSDENGTAADGVKATGSYSYTGDDGNIYTVTYTADENGYKPQGDHLPTAPPIPEAILKVIEQSMKDKEAGVYDDGSYDEAKYGYKKYQGPISHIDTYNKENLRNDDDVPLYGNNIINVSDNNKPLKYGTENESLENDRDYDLIESDGVETAEVTDEIEDKVFSNQNSFNPAKLHNNIINQSTSRRRPLPHQFNNLSNFQNTYDYQKQDNNDFSGLKNNNNQLNKLLNKDELLLEKNSQKPLRKLINILKPNPSTAKVTNKISGTVLPQSEEVDITAVENYHLGNTLSPVESRTEGDRLNSPNLFGENQSIKKYSAPKSSIKSSNNQYIPPVRQELGDNFSNRGFSTRKPVLKVPLQDSNIETSTAFTIPDEFSSTDQQFTNDGLDQLNRNNYPGYSTTRLPSITHNEPQIHKVHNNGHKIPIKVLGPEISFPTKYISRRPGYPTSITARPSTSQHYSIDDDLNQPLYFKAGLRPGQRIVTTKKPGYTISSTTPLPSTSMVNTVPVYSYTHTYPTDSTFTTTYSPSTTSKSTITFPDETLATEYDYTVRPSFVSSTPGFVSIIPVNGLPTTTHTPNFSYGDKIIEGIEDEYGNPIIIKATLPTQVINEDSSLSGYSYPSPNQFKTVGEGNPSTQTVKGQSSTTSPNTKYGNQSTNSYREDFSGPKQPQTYDDDTGYHYKKK